jgi:hypothetical protein
VRIILSIILCAFSLGAAELERPANTLWRGTNSRYAVSIALKAPRAGVTNYGSARVFIGGQSHPASCYRGAAGWVTVDYGEGADPARILQFKIVRRGVTQLVCRTDNTDTVLTNAPPETFVLHRQ